MKFDLLYAKSTEILNGQLFTVVRKKVRRQKKEREGRGDLLRCCVTANSGELHKRNASGCKYDGLTNIGSNINPLNAELNPICHLVALLGAHPILHISRIRVNISVGTDFSVIYNKY
jgi:hypothetical protein